ncbi:MAG: GNAT family N-acetyltransferase [Candidatus Thiodiazotropha endolucinida]
MSAKNMRTDRFEITSASESHYDGILELFTTPDEFYLIYPSGIWPFDRSQLERLARERSDFTVVLDSKQVIGFANLYTSIAGDRYFIGNLVISDAYRGQGIGRRLVRHMCDRIFERYASTVYISVFTDNTPALLLYASLGFMPFDIERRTTPKGDSAALLYMRLDARSW